MIDVDPITVEVIGNHILAIAEEMGVTLVKTSFSTNIKERRDCSAALLDPAGRTIAQAEHVPIHMGSMLGLVGEIHKRYPPAEVRSGDVFIANDPYSGGGTHLPDITVAAPFFLEGRLIAFVSDISHHSDVGGSRAAPRDVYSEGLRIPPMKIVESGRLRQDLLEFILLNCRLAEERNGDLRAQFAALHTGLVRLEALAAKYGPAVLETAIQRLFEQAERQARAAIARIPPGRYECTDYLDDDGLGNERIPIKVAVIVEGDELTCDFTGTAPQVQSNLNAVPSALAATVYYTIKAAVDPTLPANGGYYRAIRIVAPAGTIVNCSPPAPVDRRMRTLQRVVDAIFGALAQAIPEKVVATCANATAMHFYGRHPAAGGFYAYPEVMAGGYGACSHKDGADGVQANITNTSNLPIEAMEPVYPLLVERYELIPDSGGAGRYRGGLGLLRQYRLLGQETRLRTDGDRQKIGTWGLQDALSGRPGRLTINPDTPQAQVMGSKLDDHPLRQGDIVRMCTPGGGGYGDPRQRDRAAVARDIRQGKVTLDEAVHAYGWTPAPAANT